MHCAHQQQPNGQRKKELERENRVNFSGSFQMRQDLENVERLHINKHARWSIQQARSVPSKNTNKHTVKKSR